MNRRRFPRDVVRGSQEHHGNPDLKFLPSINPAWPIELGTVGDGSIRRTEIRDVKTSRGRTDLSVTAGGLRIAQYNIRGMVPSQNHRTHHGNLPPGIWPLHDLQGQVTHSRILQAPAIFTAHCSSTLSDSSKGISSARSASVSWLYWGRAKS